ncbi:MAG: LamG-like jellyroll fold domain-containing protein [Spirochaetota bacterium]
MRILRTVLVVIASIGIVFARPVQQNNFFRQHEFSIESFTEQNAEVTADNIFTASFSCSPSTYLMANASRESPPGATVNLASSDGKHTLTFFARNAGTYTVWVFASKQKNSTYNGVFYYVIKVTKTVSDEEAADALGRAGASTPLSFTKAFSRLGFTPSDVNIKESSVVCDGTARVIITAKDDIEFETPQISYYSEREGGFVYQLDGKRYFDLRFIETGLHAVSIRARLRSESEFQTLFTVNFYAKQTLSDEEYEKRFFLGSAMPTEELIAADYEYDYTYIDDHVKKTPKDVESTIASLAAYFMKGARNEREKARAIFKWEQLNLTYVREGPREVNQIFKSRVTQCDGYSKLFHELATAMGMRAKWVLSHDGAHAYSLVMADGVWRVLDATWHMFFTHPKLMIRQNYHYPKYERYQLLQPRLAVGDYESKNFAVLGEVEVRERIPMSDTLAALGMNVAEFSHQFLKVDSDGKEEFIFTSRADTELTHNLIRTGEKKTQWGTYKAENGRHSIAVALPAMGDYLMHVWARQKGTKEWKFLFTYTIRYDATKKEKRPPIKTFEPILYQSFDATGRDQSSYKNKVEISGSPAMAIDRFGRRVCAVNFDGTDDSILVPKERGGNSITGSVSISLWVKPASVDGLTALATFKGNGKLEKDNALWGLYIRSGKLLAVHESALGEKTMVSSDTSVPADKWTHIVLIRDAQKMTYTFVVNGTPEAAKAYRKNASGGEHSHLVIGNAFGETMYYRGILDDIRIFADALPSVEADKLYREGGYPDNLVTTTYYPFRRVDASGKQFAPMGVVRGAAPAPDRLGRGGAYAFSGSGDFIETPLTAIKGDFTISTWCLIGTDAENRPRMIFSKTLAPDGGGYEFILGVTPTGAVSFGVSDANSGKRATTKDVERGKWMHAAAVVNGNTIAVYIDGTLAASGTLSGERSEGTGALRIGRGDGETYFLGTLDDVRVFEKALSEGEIAKLAQWK